MDYQMALALVPISEELCKYFIPKLCILGKPVTATLLVRPACGCKSKPDVLKVQKFDNFCKLQKYSAENKIRKFKFQNYVHKLTLNILFFF